MRNTSKLMYSVLMIVLMGAFMYSCTQESSTSKQESIIENRSADDAPVIVLSDDEIVEIAEGHNAYLEILFQDFDYGASDWNQELLSQAMANPWADFNADQMNEFYNTAMACDKTQVLQVLNDPVAEAYIEEADGLLQNATSISTLITDVENLVNDANDDPDLVEKDAVQLYGEILKKSSFFWAKPSMGGNGLGDKIRKLLEDQEEIPSRPRWWLIVIADIAGGLYGGKDGEVEGAVAVGATASAGAMLIDYD